MPEDYEKEEELEDANYSAAASRGAALLVAVTALALALGYFYVKWRYLGGEI